MHADDWLWQKPKGTAKQTKNKKKDLKKKTTDKILEFL